MSATFIIGVGGAGTRIIVDGRLQGAGRRLAIDTGCCGLASVFAVESCRLDAAPGFPGRDRAGYPAALAAGLPTARIEALLLRERASVIAVAGLGGATGTAVLPALAVLCARHALAFRAAVTVPPMSARAARAAAFAALEQLRELGVDVYVFDMQVSVNTTRGNAEAVLADARDAFTAHVLEQVGAHR